MNPHSKTKCKKVIARPSIRAARMLPIENSFKHVLYDQPYGEFRQEKDTPLGMKTLLTRPPRDNS